MLLSISKHSENLYPKEEAGDVSGEPVCAPP